MFLRAERILRRGDVIERRRLKSASSCELFSNKKYIITWPSTKLNYFTSGNLMFFSFTSLCFFKKNIFRVLFYFCVCFYKPLPFSRIPLKFALFCVYFFFKKLPYSRISRQFIIFFGTFFYKPLLFSCKSPQFSSFCVFFLTNHPYPLVFHLSSLRFAYIFL